MFDALVVYCLHENFFVCSWMTMVSMFILLVTFIFSLIQSPRNIKLGTWYMDEKHHFLYQEHYPSEKLNFYFPNI